jgi:hypothetical protein
MCEKRVTKRGKIYDRKCPGLYVSITTAGVATFSAKITDPASKKQVTAWLGVYNEETFTVDHARAKVYGLKARRHGGRRDPAPDQGERGQGGQDRR